MGVSEFVLGHADALGSWPGIGALARRLALARFRANRDQNLFFGVYATREDAAAAARACGTAGYDNAPSAELYDHRTRIEAHDYPVLCWLMRSLLEGMSGVFDVGGATGMKFLAFREPLQRWPELRWRVYDVEAMVARGRRLADERGGEPQLQFGTDFHDGEGFDVLLASGVLQYLPHSLAEMLAAYRRLPRRILINTAAIHPQLEYFTVNSIGTAFCPYRVQTQASVVRGLTALGYRLREAWINPDKPLRVPFHPEHNLHNYSGFCLDLQPRPGAAG